MKLSVVILCYNESQTIAELVSRVLDAVTLGMERELILVDDRSGDRSPEDFDLHRRWARGHGVWLALQ